MTVLTAIRRRGLGVTGTDGSGGAAMAGAGGSWDKAARYATRPPRPSTAALSRMANIPSQIKRNQRALRERFENRHYTSAVKTYFRRLQAAVEEGDDERADTEHRQLIRLIDKAVKRGALHRNNGARKKSRAARLRRGDQA
jgi:small subunit ribosomal protein S20